MIDIAINQVEYSNSEDGATVHIFGRTPDRKVVQIDVNGFKPYFYAPEDQVAKIHPPPVATLEYGTSYTSIRGESLRRIYTVRPGDVRDAREKYRHFEADIPFATRFMIDTGLTGGVSVPDIDIHYKDMVPAAVDAPARTCIIDIECQDENGFPDPKRDSVICITCYDSFDDAYVTFLFLSENGLGEIPSKVSAGGLDNGCFRNGKHEIYSFETEKEMFLAFARYIVDKDPDVLTGWNFIDFDMPYITGRMEAIGLRPESLARIPGQTERNALRGRALFDLLTAYKKMHLVQKESYRLDAIALAELGQQKVRYTGTICDLWRDRPELLIEYNFKDVELCVGINNKDNIVGFYREIARYVGCPLDKTLNSSSVIDVYVLRKAYGKYILPSKGFTKADEFEGATVFEPSRGVRENVVVLDLKSLYPMAMMTINASPETKSPEGELRAPNGIRFKKQPDGLTRSIISDLLKERDEKKALRSTFKFGSPEYVMYDMQQNVLKVIMNTYYGVSGYSRFRLFDQEIGSAVTSVGRAIIEHTRKTVEDAGFAVIYGDSVGGDSKVPIYDRDGNFKGNVPIRSLFTSVDHIKEDGREYSNVTDLYTDTLDKDAKSVLKPILYVMRHKANKKMYRVWLNNETSIDATEDHSLFGYISKGIKANLRASERITEVKPTEIGNKISSLIVKKQSANGPIVSMNFPMALYELAGYFIGCGSFDRKLPSPNYYCHLSAGDDYEEVVKGLFEPLKRDGFVLNYWSKKKGDIAFNGPIVKILTGYMRNVDGTKKIPDFIYSETVGNRRSFLRGLFSSDGTCIVGDHRTPLVRYTSIKKSLCEEIQTLLYFEGISSSIFKDSSPNSYNGVVSGTFSYVLNVKDVREFAASIAFIETRKNEKLGLIFSTKQKCNFEGCDFNIAAVSKVEEIEYSDYVYDIEVEDTHRFFANNILVHNTDSCMIHLPKGLSKEQTIATSRSIEKLLNNSYAAFAKNTLNADVNYFSIKFEKIYARFFQAGKKKRYAGSLVWKEGKDVQETDIVGFEIRRSDTPQITKLVQMRVMEMILAGEGYEVIKAFLSDVIKKYRAGKYSLDEVGIPGGIGKALDDYDTDDAQVRGARYANTHLHTEFGKGSKPKRIYIRNVSAKYPKTDVLCFEYADQVPKEFVVDWELMLEKTIKQPISRIIEALGWEWESMDPSYTTLATWGLG